jgi:hypothetical protein
MNLSDDQTTLLRILVRRPLAFTGAETNEVRLAMLQLLTAGLVVQKPIRVGSPQIEWRITPRGRDVLAR